MRIDDPLFLSENICLGPINHENDALIESRWTHDPFFMRSISSEPAVPLSAARLRKHYENIEKSQEDSNRMVYFTVRICSDERLIGFAKIESIQWTNGTGIVQLGIGESEERRKGYGSEAARMLLRFAFDELNLVRLTSLIPEYNNPGRKLAEKLGFVVEVRRRQALERDGTRWDMLHYGLPRDRWLDFAEKSGRLQAGR